MTQIYTFYACMTRPLLCSVVLECMRRTTWRQPVYPKSKNIAIWVIIRRHVYFLNSAGLHCIFLYSRNAVAMCPLPHAPSPLNAYCTVFNLCRQLRTCARDHVCDHHLRITWSSTNLNSKFTYLLYYQRGQDYNVFSDHYKEYHLNLKVHFYSFLKTRLCDMVIGNHKYGH